MSNTNVENPSECLKIPLIVGISGHRDILQDEKTVLEKLDCFWSMLQEVAGSETPLMLLSSIAEGADHYAAVSARKRGIPYAVILPFAREDYQQDFSGTALQDFGEDLAGARKIITCPAAAGDYAQASDYIRKRSDILLTLWDGYESLDQPGKISRGGTYYQIRNAFGMDNFLTAPAEKSHLVVNLSVDRSQKNAEYHREKGEKRVCISAAVPELEVISQSSSDPGQFTVKTFAQWCAEFKEKEAGLQEYSEREIPPIEKFIGGLKKYNSSLPEKVPQDRYLRPKMEMTPDVFAIVQEDFRRYEYFNSLAEEHQGIHKSQFARIAFWSIVAGLFGQVWGGLTFHTGNEAIQEMIMHCFILFYLLLCLAVFCKGRTIAREDRYSRYIRPRVIAELMRTAVFWKLSGISKPFADHFFEGEIINGAVITVGNWELYSPPMTAEAERMLQAGQGLEAVKKSYLEDQIGYFSGYLLPEDPGRFFKIQKGEKCSNCTFLSKQWFRQYFRIYERLDGYFSRLKRFFTQMSFVLSVLLLIIYAAHLLWNFDHKSFLGLEIYREFAIGMCPFMVAVFGWLLEKNNWDSLGAQYRTSQQLFRKTLDFVSDGKRDLEDKKQILEEMLIYASEENAEWKNIKNNSKPEPMM